MRKLAAAALAAAFLAGAAQADDDSDEALRAKYDAAMAVLGDHAFHERWSAKESIRTGEEADRVLSLADDELKRIHEAVKNVRPWCQKKFLVNACIDEARKLSFEREREVRSIMNAANDVKRAERTAAYEKKRAEALAEHPLDAEEVCAVDVHLVDVCDAGDVILVRLAPHRLGLGLDAALCAERRNGAVQNAQRTLDFDGEVDVAGGIDDVEAVALPDTGRRGGRDGDAALLFLDHPVHGRSAFMHLAELVRLARVEQDTLGRGGLAGVDVRHDTEVSRML